jgi:Kef-type K+ transport system membrane component KefB
MNEIEVIICLILLFMGVPDFCRWLGRPTLVYPAFVAFGLLLAPIAQHDVVLMLEQAGEVGFLLLLFEVGLEIDPPPLRVFLPVLRRAVWWALLQYPVIFALGLLAGLQPLGCFIACAAFTGCSVGMGYPGWKHHPGLPPKARTLILQTMVCLEIMAIVLLAGESAVYENGFNWLLFLKLGGIAVVVFLISRFAGHLESLFGYILRTTTHWRMHLVVLLVLVICAIGERLGLSATKTAFFLGLFLSRIHHDGQPLDTFIAPISQRFLIPVFFFSLGLQVRWSVLFSPTGLIAIGAAALLFGWRLVINRRILPLGGGDKSFLLICPNLTIVALAASVLLKNSPMVQSGSWVLITGLFISIPAILLLPKPAKTDTPDAENAEPAPAH